MMADWLSAAGRETIRCGMRKASLRRSTGLCSFLISRRTFMQWTTPTASDFRFGFEITMYISAR